MEASEASHQPQYCAYYARPRPRAPADIAICMYFMPAYLVHRRYSVKARLFLYEATDLNFYKRVCLGS